MNILIAPDSFKGSLSSIEAAICIERGIKKYLKNVDIIKIPMADGGEGTVEALVSAVGGNIEKVKVKGPAYKEVEAFYGILNDNTAVVEMAAASGITLIENEDKNPLNTTSYGTGELIKAVLDRGCTNIIIGIGGSATNDGGTGMLQALGAKFLDEDNHEIIASGGGLSYLSSIDITDIDVRLKQCKFTIACDVDNPLCGPRGASAVFGPQKGADEDMVKLLDTNLYNYGLLLEKISKKSVINHPGAGAAGGLGAALLALFNSNLKRGIDIIIETTDMEDKMPKCDLVITGEGSIDFQTAFGKTPCGIADLAKKYNKPVIAIAGSIGEGADSLYDKGFNSIFSIVDKPMELNEAIKNASDLLEKTAERIIRTISIYNNFQ